MRHHTTSSQARVTAPQHSPSQRPTRRPGHAQGQALVIVALMLGLLVTLAVGVTAISMRRRTQARIQNALEVAGVAALHALDGATLLAGLPRLTPQAEATFRATLATQLQRVAGALTESPATVAARTSVQLVAPGGTCAGQVVPAPAICAELHATVAGGLGPYPLTLTSRTQWEVR